MVLTLFSCFTASICLATELSLFLLLLRPWHLQSCFFYFFPIPFLHEFSLKYPRLGRGLNCALQWVGWLQLHPAWRSPGLSPERPPSAPTANIWAPVPRTALTQVCETRAASVFPSCDAITGTSWTFECSYLNNPTRNASRNP